MLPNIHILATGGTISAKVADKTAMTGYTASVVGVQDLIDAVPAITGIASISGEQVTNVLSHCLTIDILKRLSCRVNELLAKDGIDGIVITHGTNTLEETAYFLNLTVNSHKPVVITGAMRPSSAISADGPINLLNAVRLAASKESRGQGVLVMLNEKINSGRDVTKTNTMAVETFQAPELGYLGYLQEGRAYFSRRSAYRHTADSEFSPLSADQFPRVDIVYCYLDDDDFAVNAAVAAGARGIVAAATGHGMMSDKIRMGLMKASQQGIAIVRASRCPFGLITATGDDEECGFIPAGSLNPQKARILLMLALTRTAKRQELMRIFQQY